MGEVRVPEEQIRYWEMVHWQRRAAEHRKQVRILLGLFLLVTAGGIGLLATVSYLLLGGR